MSRRNPWTVVVCGLSALLVIGVSGCGGGSSAALSTGASVALSQQVDAVRSAAVSHDAAAALDRLNQLRAMVASLEAKGQISGARGAQILAAASDVANQLTAISAPTTSTVPTTVAAASASGSDSSSAGASGADHGKKKKK